MNHLTLNVIASCMKEFEKIGFILNNDPVRRRNLKAKMVEIVMNADSLPLAINCPAGREKQMERFGEKLSEVVQGMNDISLEKTDDADVVKEMVASTNRKLNKVAGNLPFLRVFGEGDMAYTRIMQETRLAILEKTANLRALKSKGVHLPQEAIKRDIMKIENIGYYVDHVQFQLLLAEVVKEIYGDDEEESVAKKGKFRYELISIIIDYNYLLI